MFHEWQSYDVWFLTCGAWWTEFFVILDHFFHVTPSKDPKNQNFEKLKKMLGDTIILHKRHKNHDHMLYCSWDITCDRCNCSFSFWAIFYFFYPPNSPKNEKFQMKKTPRDIIILHKCTKNHDHIVNCSWDMAHDRRNCYFLFWAIFCPFCPNSQKIKISKKWKKHLEISSFYTYVSKIMIRLCMVPEIWCNTDRQTDRKYDM